MKKCLSLLWMLWMLMCPLIAQVNVDSLRQVVADKETALDDQADALDQLAFHYHERIPDSALYFADSLYAFGNIHEDLHAVAKALGHQGRYHAEKGAYELAEARYREAIDIWKEANSPGGVSGVLGKMGIMYYLKGDFDKALAYFEQNLTLSDSTDNKKESAGMLINIGSIHMYQGQYDMALDYFSRSLTLFEELGDDSRQAIVLGNIGIVHNNRGEYDSALAYYRQSFTIHEATDNPLGMARALGNIGLVYNYQGNYPQALANYEQSTALYESLDDQLGMAFNLTNIGMIYNAQKDYAQSLEYHQRALNIYRTLENKRAMAKALNSVGDVYFEQDEFGEALARYEKSLALHEGLNDQPGIARNRQNIGQIYQERGDVSQALEQYQSSLAIREAQEDKRGIADAATSIGRLYEEQGAYEQARFYGKKALAAAQAVGSIQELQNVANLLYQTNKATGRSAQALAMHELYYEMRDSLNSEENQRAAIRFQFEQQALADSLANEKEKALAAQAFESKLSQQRLGLGFAAGIGLLLAILATVLYRNNQRRKQTNQLLSDQNVEIEAKSAQNELLLKEIHHRVKNNLQTISSLLYLQSAHIQDADVKQAVAAGRHRVESMALIHQKLYQRENLAAIEMKDYLTNLGRSLLSTFVNQPDRISLQVDMEELELDVDTAVPLGLIVNELITNSLKYAFPDGRKGSLQVSLIRKADEKLELFVSDDGIGSANEESGTSFGSQLIQLLSVQLGGSLEQGSESGYWTRLTL